MYDILYNIIIPLKSKKKNKSLIFYEKVDNKKLYNSIKDYKKKIKNNGYGYIPIPPYIQYTFWLIANKYSYSKKFINYTYRKDMISEAVIICLKYLTTFDCNKSKKPYSYFNQAIHNTFLQFIAKEKKQSVIKEECLTIEKERREGYGRKVGEDKKNYEEKIWI